MSYLVWRHLFINHLSVSEWQAGAFWLLFMIHPIWEEQVYFELQLVQISAGLVLLGLIMNGCFICAVRKQTSLLIPSVLGGALLFSIYQAFVMLFIAAACLIFLLYYKNAKDDLVRAADVLRYCGVYIAVFLAAYLINGMITRLWFVSSDYLTSQINWGTLGFEACVNNIFAHIKDVVTGNGLFFSIGYSFTAVFVCIAAIVRLVTCGNKKFNLLYLSAIALFEIAPFLLTIYMGKIPLVRTQWALPFVIAGNFILLFQWCPQRIRLLFAAAALILGWRQFYTVNRLEYTDRLRYQSDVELSNRVIHDIEKLGLQNKPAAFIGNRTFRIPASGARGETIGLSFFDYDMVPEPHYYFSSSRIVSFMNAIGINLQCVPPEQIGAARQIAQGMPCWPQEGGIADAGDFIVVKLSEDQYYEEDFGQIR